MKLRYLFASLIAVATLFTSCKDDYEATYLDNTKVSSSYVAIPLGGGSTTIQVTVADSYSITDAPEWLTITPSTGSAGTATITFSAESTLDGRNCEVLLNSGDETQHINVIQGLSTISTATCAEVIAGVDKKTYQVKGVCTAIANTTYGNFYLNDGTGELYIYGTVDAAGAYNWSKFGIEVGDEVTVQGPKTTFGSTVELVDATFISVTKSLIKCDSLTVDGVKCSELPIEGGEVVAHITNKGGALNVQVPEDAESWLSIKSITGKEVTFKVAANTGGDRSTTLVFSTTSSGKTYTSQAALTQKGAIVAATVAEFNAASVGDTQYRVTGVISSVDDATKGNFTIKDATGSLYVYKASGLGTLKAGDIVTLVGKRGQYNTTIEMVSGNVETSTVVPAVTVADFRKLDDDATKSKYYMITGTVVESAESSNDLANGKFAIQDETGTVYVYKCAPGWGGKNSDFASTGVKLGDKISIIAYKSSYNDLIEACGGVYFSTPQ